MSRGISIIIDNDGETKVEAVGYKGAGCTKATAPLTAALIGSTTTHLKLPAYYQADHSTAIREAQ
jgi:hypothetical protein